MALNPEYMFENQYISEPLKRALGLPNDVWYLVLNNDLNNAYFLDGARRAQTKSVKPDVRPLVELAARQKRESEQTRARRPQLRRSFINS